MSHILKILEKGYQVLSHKYLYEGLQAQEQHNTTHHILSCHSMISDAHVLNLIYSFFSFYLIMIMDYFSDDSEGLSANMREL